MNHDLRSGSAAGSADMVGAPVRVGVIGLGRQARQVLVPAIQRCDALRIVAVATSRPETAEAVRVLFGYPAVVGYAALLCRDDVEAVVIATPAAVQMAITVASLGAGKHVFCETPGPRSGEELRTVAQAQAAAARVVGYDTCLRYAPIYRHLRDQIPSVRAGGQVVLTIRYYAGLRHVVDLAHFLLGAVARVAAWRREQQVAVLEFATGDLGIIHCGGPAHLGIPMETADVSGGAGLITARGSRELTAYVLPDPTGIDELDFASAPATVWAPSTSIVYGALNPLVLRGYVPALEAFAAAVRQGTSTPSGIDQAARAIGVEQAIDRAIAAGHPVEVGTGSGEARSGEQSGGSRRPRRVEG